MEVLFQFDQATRTISVMIDISTLKTMFQRFPQSEMSNTESVSTGYNSCNRCVKLSDKDNECSLCYLARYFLF